MHDHRRLRLGGCTVAAPVAQDHRVTESGGGSGVEAKGLKVGNQPVGGTGTIGRIGRIGRDRGDAKKVHQPVQRLGQVSVDAGQDGVEGHQSGLSLTGEPAA